METAVLLICAVIAWTVIRSLRRRGLSAPRQRLQLDPQRHASAAQRSAMWRRQRGRCALCKRPLRRTVVHAHHVIPWSRGGRTAVSNMVLLHAHPCHARITAQDARRYHWRRAA
jgi:5-methylcytosine-specific restriction endonuclease McrA